MGGKGVEVFEAFAALAAASAALVASAAFAASAALAASAAHNLCLLRDRECLDEYGLLLRDLPDRLILVSSRKASSRRKQRDYQLIKAQPKHTRGERRDSPEHRAVGAARAPPAAAAVRTGGHVAASLIGAVAAVARRAAAAVGTRGARQSPGIGAAATSCWAGGLAAPQALRGPVGHRAVVPASQRAQRPPPPAEGGSLDDLVRLRWAFESRSLRLLLLLDVAEALFRRPPLLLLLPLLTASARSSPLWLWRLRDLEASLPPRCPSRRRCSRWRSLLRPLLLRRSRRGLRSDPSPRLWVPEEEAGLPPLPPVPPRGHTPAATSTATAVLLRLGQREDPTLLRLLPGAGPAAPLLPPSCAPLASRQPLDLQRGARAEARGGGRGGGGAATAVAAAEGTGIASACGVPPTSSPPSSDPRLPPAPCPSCSASPRARRRARRGCGLLPGQTLAISPAGNGSGGGGTPSTRAGRETRHDNPGRDSSPWIPGHSGVRSGLRASGKQESGRQSSRSRSSSYSRQRKHQMRRALTRGAVPSPPSAPGGGGAASAALSARAAQRGSTTFLAASLHRALTLGASSGEGSGRDNNTPPPPPLRRRRRPPVVAATHRRRLGSGLGLTTTPSLGPRALCGPRVWGAGRGGGDRAAADGWGSERAGLGGGLFPGRWGRGRF
nr:uncharacterized protein LOC110567418 [Aotus nancymaae]